MKGKLLFVYGTMLQKGCNHSRLYEVGALYLGDFLSDDQFSMWVMGRNGAPIAIRDEDYGFPIRGELYAVPEEGFPLIDEMEGHPTYYRREPVGLTTLDYQVIHGLDVETYVFQHSPGDNDREVAAKLGVLSYEPG